MSDYFELPKGHRSFQEASHRMSIDESNNLFWNGRPVKTELSVPLIAKVFAVLLGASAFLGGIGSFAQGWVALQQANSQSKPNSIDQTRINVGNDSKK